MKLHYTDRAKHELDCGFEWYELRQKGLGFKFLDAIENSVKNLLFFPELYGIYYKNFRRCIIKHFPYSVFYTIEGQNIIIHAIFDNRQNPQNLP
jgi:plasmid stabilization system protein ParE